MLDFLLVVHLHGAMIAQMIATLPHAGSDPSSGGAPTDIFNALDSPLTVFDLRRLDDRDLRTATMHLVAQHVWNTVRRDGRDRALYVDEAHLVCKRQASGAFLESLTKRAHKHGLRVVPITQDPVDSTPTAPSWSTAP